MSRRRRRRLTIALAAVAVTTASGLVLVERWSSPTTPLTVDELVIRSASTTPTTPPMPTPTIVSTSTTTATGPPTGATSAPPGTSTTTSAAVARRPADGVYAYATTGTEQLDVLTGVQRTYPTETGVVVASTACGVDLSWRPYEERTYTISLCDDANTLRFDAYSNHYEFFDNAQQRRLTCTPAPAWQPADGSRFETECTGDGVTERRRGSVAVTTLSIAGSRRPATHVVLETETSGSTEGTTHEELWIDASTGLLLQLQRTVRNRTPTPVGTANYAETLTLTLTSVTASVLAPA
jgi:hypothetical protein